MVLLRSITAATLLWTFLVVGAQDGGGGADYGVDCSWPIHGKESSCGDLLGDRKPIYEDFMAGCRAKFGKKGVRCDQTEEDRIEMSRRQPQSMVVSVWLSCFVVVAVETISLKLLLWSLTTSSQNYTSTGFMKIRAPKEVMDLLTNHWEKNKNDKKDEQWGVGNIYTNNWAAPTYMVSVEDTNLRGGGYRLKEKIWEAAKSTIEQWTGMELKPTSMYGIRMYTEGAILSPHVDRLPLVSSCIINVAQDVDEPWPLEVYDRHDRAVNVTMEPGDMVLYESGSLMHGRPFPLKGRFFANIFIHFEPTGRHVGDKNDAFLDELDDFLPPYLVPGSPEVENWAARNPHGWKKPVPSAPIQQVTSPEAHHAAATGDLDRLEELARKNKKALHKKDANGWTPLHEAVRGGHEDIVAMLIQHGAEKDARTGPRGEGSSPLNLALMHHTEHHPVSKYLQSVGAKDIAFGEL